MKQFGLLMIGWISLMGIIFSAGATSTTEPSATPDPGDCIEFTKISDDDITVSWERSCFGDDNSYKIELFSDDNCTRSYFPCSTSTCEIAIKEMPCAGPPIIPCSDATYIITGNTNGINYSDEVNAAPKINDGDWSLIYNISDLTLDVKWGPIAEEVNENVKCATKALVYASCTVEGEVIGNDPILKDELDPTQIGSASLDVLEECLGKNVELLVTYLTLSGNVPTDAMMSKIIPMPVITTTTPKPTTTTTIIDSTESPGGFSDWEWVGIGSGIFLGVAFIGGGGVFVMKKKSIGWFA